MIARQFKVDNAIRQAEETKSVGNIFRAVFAGLGLGFFNIVFVLGPFLAVIGILIGLIGAAVGITLGGIAFLLASIFHPWLPDSFNYTINPAAGIFISIGMTALGLLFLIGDFYFAKFLYTATIKYLKMNIRIIQK